MYLRFTISDLAMTTLSLNSMACESHQSIAQIRYSFAKGILLMNIYITQSTKPTTHSKFETSSFHNRQLGSTIQSTKPTTHSKFETLTIHNRQLGGTIIKPLQMLTLEFAVSNRFSGMWLG